jgi:redox-sensitive bicupin YhaK (pirin superfamily)
MGNTEILRRGDLQLTSAGTGIRHSEHQHGQEPVHFLQIWSLPHTKGLKPSYFTRHITDEDKNDKWAPIVAPVGAEGVLHEREGSGPAPVQSSLKLAASIISPGTKLTHSLPETEGERKAYFHVIQRSGYNPGVAKGAEVKISGAGVEETLKEGDGAYMFGSASTVLTVENVGSTPAEVLLFDVDI